MTFVNNGQHHACNANNEATHHTGNATNALHSHHGTQHEEANCNGKLLPWQAEARKVALDSIKDATGRRPVAADYHFSDYGLIYIIESQRGLIWRVQYHTGTILGKFVLLRTAADFE